VPKSRDWPMRLSEHRGEIEYRGGRYSYTTTVWFKRLRSPVLSTDDLMSFFLVSEIKF